MPTVSIITPCYNAGQYIERCIESVLAQDFADWELIIVDDGSKDDSLSICRKFESKDSRIKVLSKANGGVSSARNMGLRHAAGKWLMFLDSDDILPAGALKYLVGCTENCGISPDFVMAGYTIIRNNEESACPPLKAKELSARELCSELFHPSDYPYQGYVWSNLFLKSIIEQYNLQFDEEIVYNEDRLFSVNYLSHCRAGIYTTFPVYIYFINSGSAMSSINGTGYWKFETDLDAFVKMKKPVQSFGSRGLAKLYYREVFRSYMRNRGLNQCYGANNKTTNARLACKYRSAVPRWTRIGLRTANLFTIVKDTLAYKINNLFKR